MEVNDIAKIYKYFDKIGCLSFTTVNEEGEPESRIAHLRGYDDEGIYFMTMYTKAFYRHIKNNGLLSICGLNANTSIEHDENGHPIFQGGYAARMSGKVKEISIDELKAKNNPMFEYCIYDQEKYKAMVVLCITSARGDIFDYDFEKVNRDHKLERIYFSYNGAKIKYAGLHIDKDKCTGCGLCMKKCSFNAIIQEGKKYTTDKYRCDECGDCYLSCPSKAISYN